MIVKMQADAQEQGQVRTQDGRFPPGVSGNPLGGLSRKRRIQAKAEELAVESALGSRSPWRAANGRDGR